MDSTKTRNEKVQEYYDLSCHYLESAKISEKNELFEPAMFLALHALELAVKAALFSKTDEAWKTHNIGGQFGKYYRKDVSDTICRRINVLLSKYNLPRYPSEGALDPEEVEQDIKFIEELIEHHIAKLIV